VVLVGSHVDTVIEGGWLDGALGVAAGVQVVHEAAATGGGRPVGLVVFRDEEGVRFRTGLFGSKVFAGLCTEADLAKTDEQGVRVRDVVPDPDGCLAYRPPVTPTAYLECHIEQGMRLIESQRRVGVVTGIVGIRRLEVTAEGAANHAGTTEMHRRLDALIPIATLVARLPSLVQGRADSVATCGRIAAHPGAANIVPGTASAMVELRAPDADALAALTSGLEHLMGSLTPPTPDTRMAPLRLRPINDVAPTSTDPALREQLEAILTQRRLPFDRLYSMAGHDAQHAARVCPAGMFFIPSLGGISHSPDEDSREEDIVLAGELLLAWAQHCRQPPRLR
jgi:N-carbamoyl-L-amino-acid hydrolase